MRILFLDTSTEKGFCGYAEDNKIVWKQHFPFGLRHSEALVPALKKGQEELGWDLSSLDKIIVGIGPGSYTGMRVAGATAQSLALACNIPMVAICSLEAFRSNQEPVIADARVGGIYLLLSGEPTLVSPQSVEKALAAHCVIHSPNPEPLVKRFPFLQEKLSEADPDPQIFITQPGTLLSPGDRIPFYYLRKTEAEINACREPSQ